MKRILSILVAICLAATLFVPAMASGEASGSVEPVPVNPSMRLDDAAWTQEASTGAWCLTDVPYCAAPVSASEKLSIFVPGAYMDEDGNLTDQEVNGYNAATAPIIYSINMAGYGEATPGAAGPAMNLVSSFLDAGYVVVTPGSRGKATTDADGKFIGKGAACIADLKAGIRFIRHNADLLPGDTECIVVTGNSAGGAMSVLIAASGNNPAFDPYLEEIGAIMTETDDVYAAQAYCPAQDMENADSLYEWLFAGQTAFSGSGGGPSSEPKAGELTEFQQALSADLAQAYIEYINGLGLTSPDGTALTLDGLRAGSYYDCVLEALDESLALYIEATFSADNGIDREAAQAYVDELNGTDPWIALTFTDDGVACTISSLDAYTAALMPRGSECPSNDTFDMVEFPNQIHGTETVDRVHFSTTIADLFAENDYSTLDGYDPEIVAAYADAANHTEAVHMLNAMDFIGSSDTASYIRIRTGSVDATVCPLVSLNLALALNSKTDADVDFAFVWNKPHGDQELNKTDLIDWIEAVCRSQTGTESSSQEPSASGESSGKTSGETVAALSKGGWPLSGSGDTSLTAFKTYLKAYMDCVPEMDGHEEELYGLIDAESWEAPVAMAWENWFEENAMTYDEFVAANGAYSLHLFSLTSPAA